MVLNDYGNIVCNIIIEFPNHNKNMKLDIFVIMPNHVHGIIVIENCRERFETVPQTTIITQEGMDIKNNGIPEFVKQLKTFSTRRINELRKRNGLEPFPTNTIWQKSYHDRIIRNEPEYLKIWYYIYTNPLKWQDDCFYSESMV